MASVELAGLPVDALTRDELVDRVFEALARGRGGWIVTVNVDHLQRCAARPDVAAMCRRADWVVADGAPLLWAARLRGTPLPDRVAGSDLVWLLAERAARQRRSLYLLGGDPGAAEAAAGVLGRRWPELRVAGWSSPRVDDPPSPEQVATLRRSLLEADPDLVYVGLGAPKQERVIDALRGELPGVWWMGVGISLSFLAGQVQRAPVWLQRLGLEWLHRMAQEPRRLLRRYLVTDLPFALRLLFRSWREGRR